ncbi:MAG: DUF481 domain-containing protein [Pirellulaceae bacterium]|nr:DUF481 domain-containing protein [Pirellulaceae bacterium]
MRRRVWYVALIGWLLILGRLPAQEHPELHLLPPVDSADVSPLAGDQLPLAGNAGPMAGDTVPEVIQKEEVIEYQWFDPHYWFRAPYWEGSLEAGLNGSEGNTNSLSIKSGMSLKRTTDYNSLGFNLNYAKTTANSVETQHYALFNGEYERKFAADSPWSFFTKTILQYDEFTAWDLRVTVNGGLGYRFLKTDTMLLKGRFGAGASREFGGAVEEWTPEAVFGADYEHQLTKKQKLVLNVDYLPAWENFEDYRLLTVLAWEVVLDEEANLHFKLAINDQYDSTPQGAEPNDFNYSMLLLWKL